MAFPPGAAPSIPQPPAHGAMNWDTPLDAVLTALTNTVLAAWQNDIDTAIAIGHRGVTPVTNSGTEIASPVDGQLCYVTSTRTYQRYDQPTTSWVSFLTRGADGSYVNSYQGAWTAKSYATGQIVTYLGSSWIATGAVSSTQIPGTDAAWTAIAASGAPGTAGKTVLNGTTNPSSSDGTNGDFWINTATNTVFGPKASGTWPSGVSMVGPQGAAGQGIATGGTSGQYLKKNSSTNYDTTFGAIVDADINGLNSVTNKALDSAVVHNTGAENIAGVKTFTSAPVVPSNSFPESAITNLTTDLAAKLSLTGGTMTGAATMSGSSSSTVAGQAQVSGDTFPRYQQLCSGSMVWGSGSAGGDTNLRRSATGVLASDNTLAAVAGAQIGAATPSLGGGVGVLGMTNAATTPTTNPSGGGVLYSDSTSRPTWRDSNGNVWVLVPSGNNNPADQGLLAWSMQPQLASAAAPALTAGVIYLARVILRSAATVTNVGFSVTNAGSGLSNCYAALFDFTGTRQAITGDLSTNFQSTGYKTIAFTGTYAAPAGNYWVALLNGAGSTLPQLAASYSTTLSAGTVNAGVTAATARWATTGTGLTAIPSSITPASNTTSNQAFLATLS